ncbi:MAG: accessory factor UbiK family protein [Alphaproteobacteria bacterium]|nr:accessory factor UbiK family protein [Alphaproteobacteria bacterium]
MRDNLKFMDDLAKLAKAKDFARLAGVKDFARLAGGAAQSLGALRGQVKALVNGFLAEMDLVTRDEFERVEALAKKARERQVALEQRLAGLEKKLSPAKTRATKRTKK